MDIHISLVGRSDLAHQIHLQVRAAVTAGALRPGDRLPSSRDLASRLGVSRNTVIAGYDRLVDEGLLCSRPGRGVYVRDAGRRRPPNRRPGRPVAPPVPQPIWDAIDPLDDFLAGPAEFDFRCGVPSTAHFPFATWRPLVSRQLRVGANRSGSGADPAGSPALRAAIARHIAVTRGVRAQADDVFITNGTQQAIDLIARVLLAPGDLVAVEDPGYLPPTMLFRSLRLQVAGVPVDAEGVVVQQIPEQARLVYVTPSHQYPLGMTMSAGRRRALLDHAERNGAVIVEDDYDSAFRYTGRPLEPLQNIDDSSRVIYTGSFSKTTLPSMRLGFLVAPPSLMPALRKAKIVTDWYTALPLQEAMAQFIDSGEYARHVRRMRRIYQQRHEVVTGILHADFADFLTVVPSVAGIHVSALMDPDPAFADRTIAGLAAQRGVRLTQPISHCAVTQRPRSGLMLGYGAIPTERIQDGLARLHDCFADAGRWPQSRRMPAS